jgi:hypothetical protein
MRGRQQADHGVDELLGGGLPLSQTRWPLNSKLVMPWTLVS